MFQELNKSGSHPLQIKDGRFQLFWQLGIIMYTSKSSVNSLFFKDHYLQHSGKSIFCDYCNL